MNPEGGIIFVRHAQSIGNTMSQDERAGCEISNTRYPLTDLGRRQAVATGEWLRDYWDDKIVGPHFCSMFQRSEETLRIILQVMGRERDEVIRTRNLNEKWDGIFHELSKADVETQYPEQIALRKSEGYYHHRPPRGENGPDVEERVKSFILQDMARGKGLRIVVGHGRWFLFFQKLVHNLSIEQFLKLKSTYAQKNCAVTVYGPGFDFGDFPETHVPWIDVLEDTKTEFA